MRQAPAWKHCLRSFQSFQLLPQPLTIFRQRRVSSVRFGQFQIYLYTTMVSLTSEGSFAPPQPEPASQRRSANGSEKLHGRRFWESIGSPKRIVAPMVDASDLAWRMLSRRHNTDLAYSPMLHARLLVEDESYLHKSLLAPNSAGDPYDGEHNTDRPLFIQFCANDPDTLLAAAKKVQGVCDAVDLNLGCPQGIARKGRYGAFLQEKPELIFNLINKLYLELDIPVTAKIRILETKEKTLEYAKMVLRAGASILTVHGRLREQKGHNTGLADWEMIRYLREQLPKETVIFANGNILYNTDVDTCLAATGADGVMSAEANLHNPAIFVPSTAQFDQRFPRIDHVCREYLTILYAVSFGDPVAGSKGNKADKSRGFGNVSLHAFKSHMFRILHAAFRIPEYHYIRDLLAKSSPRDFKTYDAVVREVERAVEAYLEANPETEETWQAILGKGGGVGADVVLLEVPWFRCQPYVRPPPARPPKLENVTDRLRARRAVEAEAKTPEDISDYSMEGLLENTLSQ